MTFIKQLVAITVLFAYLALSHLANAQNAQATVESRTVITDKLELMLISDIDSFNYRNDGTSAFKTVTFKNNYSDPIVACNFILSRTEGNYGTGDFDLGVIRVREVKDSSFDIAVQGHNSNASFGTPIRAQCLVADSGEQEITNVREGGKSLKVYAHKFEVDQTNIANADEPDRATGNAKEITDDVGSRIANNNPALLSQVMTYNDTDRFFTSWQHGCTSRTAIAFDINDNNRACISMHTSNKNIPPESAGVLDLVTNPYQTETIGYIAIEEGAGMTSSAVRYETFYKTTPDENRGVDNMTSSVSFSVNLTDAYDHAVGDIMEMEGGNMGWLVQHNIINALKTNDSKPNSDFRYAVDDFNRGHTGEAFSGFAAGQDVVDLHLDKLASTVAPKIGDTVRFELIVSNIGRDTAESVTVTDVIPGGFSYVSDSIQGGSDQQASSSTLTWDINELPVGDSTTLTYEMVINSPTP